MATAGFFKPQGLVQGTTDAQGNVVPIGVDVNFGKEASGGSRDVFRGQEGLGAFDTQLPGTADIQGNVDLGALTERFQSLLSKSQPTIIQPASAAAQFAQRQPVDIKGLGADFFESERERRKEALREEFFGPGGKAGKALAGESAAGRLGSGVAGRQIQQTVTRPFVQAASAIESDVFQQQLKEGARVDEFNQQQRAQFDTTLSNLIAQDSKNELLASQANAELQASYDELAIKLANATTEQDFALIDLQLKNLEAANERFKAITSAFAAEKELELEELKIPLPEQ